ncbi:MAG: bacteriocin immunity protein [Ruminococcaceae bacterium]|nr:bacteriocin immunity protein [Oscillospiraceae bacterium]
MKKVLIIVLLLTFLLGFVGCDPSVNSVDENELLENTVKIELYYYENTNPKQINLSSKKTPIFDFSKATFIASLEEVHFEDVIKDIAEQDCLVFTFSKVLNEPIGKTLILYQENGDMVVLYGCTYKNGMELTRYYGECNIFDRNGVFIEHIGGIGSDYVDTLETTYFGNST